MKLINTAVDNTRREEQQGNPMFKNSRYLFLKNEASLNKTQREKLVELKMSKTRLKSLRALSIRESFQDIYKATNTEEFEILLTK